MRSLVIDSYTLPENYKISTFPVPPLSSPKDVIVRVEAACINPGDVKLAMGSFKAMMSFTFPHKLGQDLSGTVVQVGEGVTEFSVGDDVYGMLPLGHGGEIDSFLPFLHFD
jgi:NADPH:quinone reductase-like Zn-dependent oxidoreductase